MLSNLVLLLPINKYYTIHAIHNMWGIDLLVYIVDVLTLLTQRDKHYKKLRLISLFLCTQLQWFLRIKFHNV